MQTSAESQFLDLSAEWASILIVERQEREAKVRDWELRFLELRAEQDALLRDGKWRDGASDTLGVIGASRREAFHSSLLAWLLDPRGRHGFGVAFLASFFRRCTATPLAADLHRARSALEVSRGDTRADIVVTGPGFSIVIENKVDAGEQFQQCDRIYHHFGLEPGSTFVFLSPTGRAPETATGRARDAFVSLSHADIASILRDVLRDAPATQVTDRGREVAHDYLATLEREFQ